MTPAEKFSKKYGKTKMAHPSGRKVVWHCRILEMRRELGLTLREIEGETGVSSAVLSTIEHGTDPQLSTASRIAAFFGKPIHEIWTGRIHVNTGPPELRSR